MIKLDITDRWPELRESALGMEKAVLEIYGAAKVELANWPYARLLNARDQTLGYIQVHGYPRITLEPALSGAEGDERIYLELSDIVIPFGPQQRNDMRELLATEAHARWAVDMSYLFRRRGTRNPDGSVTIFADYVQHVERLILQSYKQLTGVEKAHARSAADRIMELFDPKPEG